MIVPLELLHVGRGRRTQWWKYCCRNCCEQVLMCPVVMHVRWLVSIEWARPRETTAVNITAMASLGRVTSSLTSPIDSACAVSHRLPMVTSLLSPVVSEIFGLKDGHTHSTQVHTPAYGWGTGGCDENRCRCALCLVHICCWIDFMFNSSVAAIYLYSWSVNTPRHQYN